jgi:hypothetical protein
LTKYSTIVQTDSKISLAVDNVKIGGVNLLPNSAAEWVGQTMTSIPPSAYGLYRNNLNHIFELLVGQEVTFSFDIKTDSPIPGSVLIYGDNGAPRYRMPGKTLTGITNEWQRASVTDRIIETEGIGQARIEFFGANNPAITKIFIRNFKLEKGNKATDWTESPEDNTAKLLVTGIDIENKKITLTADDVIFRGRNPSDNNFVKIQSNGRLWANEAEFTNIKAVSGEFTGTINAESGKIGGFNITNGRLEGSNINNQLLLSNNLIRFSGSESGANTSVFLGVNTLPATSGITAAARIEVSRTASNLLGGQIGMYLRVEGQSNSDSSPVSGSNAIYIERGTITGLRYKIRRISAGTTLSLMDTAIIGAGSGTSTLTLPTGPEDGQFYWIFPAGRVFNLTRSGTQLIVSNTFPNGTAVHSFNGRVWHFVVFDGVNNRWFASWLNS